jgi:hypothetical protein
MAYNPYRWWTKGRKTKPLPQSSPLLLKIKNGDFEYSPFFREAKDNEELYQQMYDDFMQTSGISDMSERKVEAHQNARMKRIKAEKLKEKGHEEDLTRIYQLRKELTLEFGRDLWEEAMEAKLGGRGTTEDLYWWYKKKVGFGQTPSEIAIKLGRNTTRGLR